MKKFRLSNYFFKTNKVVKDYQIGTERLLKGNFVHQECSGIYNFLPIGYRMLRKLSNIVSDEMEKIGCNEGLMSSLQDLDKWKKSGRYHSYGKEMLRLFDRNEREMCYSPTAEEQIIEIYNKLFPSYKDLSKSFFQISWKFRDELRPRGGLLRGRHFLMKDAYSFDLTKEDSYNTYVNFFHAYINIFSRMGLDFFPLGGEESEIGGDFSHEFVVLLDFGETNLWINEEILIKIKNNDLNKIKTVEEINKIAATRTETSGWIHKKGVEIAEIFVLGDNYSRKMNVSYTDKDNKPNYPHMGCYGIGVTRILGLIVETQKFFNVEIAPFHLIIIPTNNEKQNIGNEIFQELNSNMEIVIDDRNESFGEKIKDAEIMGIPYFLIVGKDFEFRDNLKNETKIFNNKKEIVDFIKNLM